MTDLAGSALRFFKLTEPEALMTGFGVEGFGLFFNVFLRVAEAGIFGGGILLGCEGTPSSSSLCCEVCEAFDELRLQPKLNFRRSDGFVEEGGSISFGVVDGVVKTSLLRCEVVLFVLADNFELRLLFWTPFVLLSSCRG